VRFPLMFVLLATSCAPRAAMHQPTPAFPPGATVQSHSVVPGVTHTVVVDPAGPWTIHLLEVETATCMPVLEVRKPDGRLSTLARTTELAAGAVAAVNADFFRAPGGTPVGAHVTDGTLLAGPTEWPVLGVDARGGWRYGRARLDGFAVAGADSARLTQVNREATSFIAYQGTTAGVALHTSRADSLPQDSAARRLLLRVLSGDEVRGHGIVMAVDSPAAATYLHAGQAALLVRGSAADWGGRRVVGDTVRWHARVLVDDGTGEDIVATDAVGGFPALLLGGRDVLGLQTVRRSFGEGRHPRTAVGWTADRSRFFLVVVDGRQEHSDGMTLPEMVRLFRRLGASEALNLDGGGSTAMVIQGRLVNQPSDEAGERAVGNALALAGCRR
jgi:hypothetical protein